MTYYRASVEALDMLFVRSINATSPQGASVDELAAEFEQLVAELQRQTTLCLVACYEGMLRVDALNRVYARRKDPLSRALRNRGATWLYKKATAEALLELWKKHAEVNAHKVGAMKPLFRRRHWLAHGRYWDDAELPPASPELAESMAEQFFESLPGFPA